MKKKALYIAIPIVIIIGAVIGAYFYINNTIYKASKDENIFVDKEHEQQAQYQEEKGIFNILLLGLDGRTRDSDSRTDSMILATIDTSKKKVKLVSFMRDMYVPIPDHGQSRINSAFAIGGPELLMKTLNQDFNLDIQYYVTIDFKAFQAMVDKMGGIDVDVKDYELDQINYYIREANWSHPIYLKQAGYQHLNGQQALSYCRIRKVGNNDYERTERQRRVLALLINKAKNTNVFKLPQLFTTILPYIKTNIPTTKLANLGYTVFKFGNTSVDTARIPSDGAFKGMVINGADVLVPDIEKNVAFLDNFLTSSGSAEEANVPAYMANNFHADDKAIDKRGIKRNLVKIIIPKESKDSHTFDQKNNTDTDETTTIVIGESDKDNNSSVDTVNQNGQGEVKDNKDNSKNGNLDNNNNNNNNETQTSTETQTQTETQTTTDQSVNIN